MIQYHIGQDYIVQLRFVEVGYDKSEKYKVKYPKNKITVIENV